MLRTAAIAPATITAFVALSVACNSILGACTRELGFAVEPAAGSIRIGESLTLKPRAWSCGGQEQVPIDILWTTSDTAVIRVEPTGRVIGVRVGDAIVKGMDRGPYGVGPFHVPVHVEP